MLEAEFSLQQAEGGRTCFEVRFDDETASLTQAGLAELYQTTITKHIASIYCKPYLQVRLEGDREVQYPLSQYLLVHGARYLATSIDTDPADASKRGNS